MTTTSTSCAAVVVRAPGRRAGCTASTSGVSAARRGALHLQAVAWESMSSTNGGPAGLLDSDGKGEGERGFPASAFLRDDRYGIQHGDNTPWMYHDRLIIRLYTSYNMVYYNHVVII